MSEQNEHAMQDVLNLRYFAERMLRALYEDDANGQEETLYELARLAAVTNHIAPVPVYTRLVGIWNWDTADLRKQQASADEARQTVFRIIGDMFAMYRLPMGGYEEDEL